MELQASDFGVRPVVVPEPQQAPTAPVAPQSIIEAKVQSLAASKQAKLEAFKTEEDRALEAQQLQAQTDQANLQAMFGGGDSSSGQGLAGRSIDAFQSGFLQAGGVTRDMYFDSKARIGQETELYDAPAPTEPTFWNNMSNQALADKAAGYDRSISNAQVAETKKALAEDRYIDAGISAIKSGPELFAGSAGKFLPEIIAGSALVAGVGALIPASAGVSAIGLGAAKVLSTIAKIPKVGNFLANTTSGALKKTWLAAANMEHEDAVKYEEVTGNKKPIMDIAGGVAAHALLASMQLETFGAAGKDMTAGAFKDTMKGLWDVINPTKETYKTFAGVLFNNGIQISKVMGAEAAQEYLETWKSIIGSSDKSAWEQMKNEDNRLEALTSAFSAAGAAGGPSIATRGLGTGVVGVASLGKVTASAGSKALDNYITKQSFKLMSKEDRADAQDTYNIESAKLQDFVNIKEQAMADLDNVTSEEDLFNIQDEDFNRHMANTKEIRKDVNPESIKALKEEAIVNLQQEYNDLTENMKSVRKSTKEGTESVDLTNAREEYNTVNGYAVTLENAKTIEDLQQSNDPEMIAQLQAFQANNNPDADVVNVIKDLFLPKYEESKNILDSKITALTDGTVNAKELEKEKNLQRKTLTKDINKLKKAETIKDLFNIEHKETLAKVNELFTSSPYKPLDGKEIEKVVASLKAKYKAEIFTSKVELEKNRAKLVISKVGKNIGKGVIKGFEEFGITEENFKEAYDTTIKTSKAVYNSTVDAAINYDSSLAMGLEKMMVSKGADISTNLLEKGAEVVSNSSLDNLIKVAEKKNYTKAATVLKRVRVDKAKAKKDLGLVTDDILTSFNKGTMLRDFNSYVDKALDKKETDALVGEMIQVVKYKRVSDATMLSNIKKAVTALENSEFITDERVANIKRRVNLIKNDSPILSKTKDIIDEGMDVVGSAVDKVKYFINDTSEVRGLKNDLSEFSKDYDKDAVHNIIKDYTLANKVLPQSTIETIKTKFKDEPTIYNTIKDLNTQKAFINLGNKEINDEVFSVLSREGYTTEDIEVIKSSITKLDKLPEKVETESSKLLKKVSKGVADFFDTAANRKLKRDIKELVSKYSSDEDSTTKPTKTKEEGVDEDIEIEEDIEIDKAIIETIIEAVEEKVIAEKELDILGMSEIIMNKLGKQTIADKVKSNKVSEVEKEITLDSDMEADRRTGGKDFKTTSLSPEEAMEVIEELKESGDIICE